MHPLVTSLLLGLIVFAFYSLLTQSLNGLALFFILFFVVVFYGIYVRLNDPRRPEETYEHFSSIARRTIPEQPYVPGLTKKI
jgi:hypothetical protein